MEDGIDVEMKWDLKATMMITIYRIRYHWIWIHTENCQEKYSVLQHIDTIYSVYALYNIKVQW